MNLLSLERFNHLCFSNNPVKLTKLQRWCRKRELPARKIGGEWYVDLDAFNTEQPTQKHHVAGYADLIVNRLKASRQT